ncbi:TIGR03364 family FAD-dependent oxidoreductase [Isoptericola dokdonensis]|uniref:D-amino acid dehydrogenase small subunit n=1 Tax=Isoptericola dokdonensis DS-3 TaxID=1300344 RepID=A0A168ETI6_9MICO|nr:TIGR03364 family FAD-dependent oxidoreductase [Isoptericola dokdonensis]ANC30457.1 D-amino acid dehydrogenase small subunit [Isoptericola dokdonensis DS-3]
MTGPAPTPVPSVGTRSATGRHVVVVGAGVVGLGVAAEAHRRGHRVTVVEQAAGVTGSSVQNFGHVCTTAQAGDARRYALAARERWIALGSAAGFDVAAVGTHVVARSAAELRLLGELAAERGEEEVRLLDVAEVRAVAPMRADDVVGGAHLHLDLLVDPRAAAPALARWLASQGVAFRWRTAVRGVAPGRVETTRGVVEGDVVVVAVHHDLDRLLPDLAEEVGLRRCRLHMLRVRPGTPHGLAAPLLTGWSMVRYAAFAVCPSAADVAAELAAADPDGARWDVNLMATPQGGTLILGDTHLRATDAPVFQDEEGFDLLLRLGRDLLGRDDLRVLERWQGTYATAPGREFLVAEPAPGVHVAVVTTGIGMTTGLGLAVDVLDRAGLTD